MSALSTPDDSPLALPIAPLHRPDQVARAALPQAPLKNTTNGPAPGTGAKALLARKMPKAAGLTYVSPTDAMMTPCSQKLNEAKRNRYFRGKPIGALSLPAKDAADENKKRAMPLLESSSAELQISTIDTDGRAQLSSSQHLHSSERCFVQPDDDADDGEEKATLQPNGSAPEHIMTMDVEGCAQSASPKLILQ